MKRTKWPEQRPGDLNDADLARLVRTSTALEPIARRQWLELLPFLTDADRRLSEILRAEVE